MFDFKCKSCSQSFHSSAELEFSSSTTCPECGGIITPAPGTGNDRKVFVQIGSGVSEIREADLKEQIRNDYQRCGFYHALRVYRNLLQDVSYQDAKETVLSWCGNLKEGSVMLV